MIFPVALKNDIVRSNKKSLKKYMHMQHIGESQRLTTYLFLPSLQNHVDCWKR